MVPSKRDRGLPERSMRRAAGPRKRTLFWALVVLAILVAAAAIVAVLVSGKTPGRTEEARDIMKNSDRTLESLRPKGERINQSVSIMIPDIAYLSSAQYQMTKSNLLALIEEARAVLEEVRQGYADIFNLNGVDEYIGYARVKLGLIRLDFEQLQAVEDYLDFITGALAERDTGKPLNSQALSDTTNATVKKMKELGARVEELTAEAAKIKKDRAL